MSKKSKSGSLLVGYKIPPNDNIIRTIDAAIKTLANTNITKIMVQNPYEKLVPFNLWFYHTGYKITNHFENNQNIRTRYFGSTLLTPLVTKDNQSLLPIKSFLENLSLYQPFYPETFYTMWEFLQMKHLNLGSKNFLHISHEDRLGSMEAIIFYHEKYQHTYQYNLYHQWFVGKEMYDDYDGSYRMMVPEINYLEQAYKINFIKSTNDLTKYDFISIDCNHRFENIFEWQEEELDLHANLFYLLTSLQYLKEDASMLIKLNMIAGKSWSIIFDIVYNCFKEYVFIRPIISNPFNSEVYLFLNKFTHKQSINSLDNRMLKNL